MDVKLMFIFIFIRHFEDRKDLTFVPLSLLSKLMNVL